MQAQRTRIWGPAFGVTSDGAGRGWGPVFGVTFDGAGRGWGPAFGEEVGVGAPTGRK